MIADRFQIFNEGQTDEGLVMTISEITEENNVERFEMSRVSIDGKTRVFMFATRGNRSLTSSLHYLPNALTAQALNDQARELCGRFA